MLERVADVSVTCVQLVINLLKMCRELLSHVTQPHPTYNPTL